jgi:hypothetical protein
MAARLLGVTETLRKSSGAAVPPMDRVFNEHIIGTVHAQLGEGVFTSARAGCFTKPNWTMQM